MSEFRLHNTLSRSVETLVPLHGNEVSLYTCGPTVYGEQHIGNYRTYITEDALVRTLRHFGFTVKRAMNITDVGHLVGDTDEGEDKMEVGAKRDGVTAWDVAKRYEEHFLSDLEAFRIERPTLLVRATDTIQEQIDFVSGLEEKGFTYPLEDGIYFDSSKFLSYTELARLDVEGMQGGSRVDMRGKHHITDFALWKFSEEPGKRAMEWESPWGIGFPGWHIECSAIALKLLGPELDIHAGGADHIPVHHTNEIAQSESLTGKKLAQIWFHTEFLQIDGGKMSKSLGNIYTLADIKAKGFNPLSYKLFTYSANYGSKLNFTWDAMESAQTSLDRLYALADKTGTETGELPKEYADRTDAALANDLNLSEAVAILWELLRADIPNQGKRAYLEAYEPVFALGLLDTRAKLELPSEIQALVDAREAVREAKDWAESDRLRLEIEAKGYALKDGKPGEKPEISLIRA